MKNILFVKHSIKTTGKVPLVMLMSFKTKLNILLPPLKPYLFFILVYIPIDNKIAIPKKKNADCFLTIYSVIVAINNLLPPNIEFE